MKKLRSYIRQQNIAERMIEGVSLAVILVCIAVSIRMTVVGRSLWLDEAMLAISFHTRSFFGLFVPPLAWNQSAPVMWLFLERIVSAIGGNTEISYRVLSIVFYILLLAVFGIFCRRTLHTHYPLLYTAGLADIAFLLKYSNMFKPYIADGMCVMLVLFVWNTYRRGRLRFPVFCGIYVLLIWCSNPVAFFAGGVVVVEAVASLIRRDRRRFARAVILGICIVVSFLVMYLVWLKPTIASTNLQDFWKGYEFPFIYSAKTLEEAGRDFRYILKGIGPLWQIAGWMALAAAIINVAAVYDAHLMAMTAGVAIALTASHFGFFPMSDRLWLFMIPVTVYADCFLIHWIAEKFPVRNILRQILPVALTAVLIISGGGIAKYHSGRAYINGEEANPALAYMEENLTEEDSIYVYYPGIPVFMYKMGYNTDSVGGYAHNVYYGHGYFHKGKNQKDVDWILSQKGCYVFFSHVVKYQPLDKCLDRLNASGTLEKIKNKYLYYYSADGSQAKGRFSYTIGDVKTSDDGTCTAEVTIHNTGDTCLNNGMETWVLAAAAMDAKNPEMATAVTVNQIRPGESRTVSVRLPVTLANESGQVSLQLYNMGKYAMSDRGIAPLVINIYR